MKPLILEDVEGRNINRAEKFIKASHPELIKPGTTVRDLVTQVRAKVPSSHLPKLPNGKDSCKFLPGVTRIYFGFPKDTPDGELQRKVAKLEQIMKILTTSHADEYDGNLNGLGYDDLNQKFSGVIQKNLDDEIRSLKDRKFERDTSYTIIPILDFETASEYADYVDWCVTQDEDAYDEYTKDGLGIFYFCLKDGFEDVERVPGEGRPLDEYGKSMIAISVNEDGSLNTATCRWNHEVGGDDSVFKSAKDVSEFFGVNFFETFKPKSIDQILEKIRKDAIESKLADRLGGIETKDGKLAFVEDGRLKIYRRAYADETVKCFAYDRFCWFDFDGNAVEPPARVRGDFVCNECKSLTSLEGAPREVGGSFYCEYCTSLTSLEEAPEKVGEDFYCSFCTSLTSFKGAPEKIGRDFYCRDCTSLTSLEGAPREVGGGFFCVDCTSLASLKGAPGKVGRSFYCGGCASLTSLEGAPEKIGRDFNCSYCESLTSLIGAPREIGENFNCSYCESLTSLEGAPHEVSGVFYCSGCTSLTSLEGAPHEVCKDFYCDGCTSLVSLEGAPREVGGKFFCAGCSHINSDQTEKYLEWLKTKPQTNYHIDIMSESCYKFVNAVLNNDSRHAYAILEAILQNKTHRKLIEALKPENQMHAAI